MNLFAVLLLRDLRIVKFDNKDDFTFALAKYTAMGVPCVALIYHAEADVYTVPEMRT